MRNFLFIYKVGAKLFVYKKIIYFKLLNNIIKMNLLQAVNQNNVDDVKELLANSRTNINVTDNHNFTGKFAFNFC